MKIRLLFTAFLAVLLFGVTAQVTTVGIIGSATSLGWDTDTDMIQDENDTSIWTINIDLMDGEAKFRANDNWDVNWGSVDFPAGVGVQGGDNIPVVAGTYNVTFNSTTGEYSFVVNSPIGIIGSATPGGWDTDSNMFVDSNGVFFTTLNLIVGDAKFRKDDDWAVNWGSLDFPTGVGAQDGDNIPIPEAGKYFITFDTTSGEYNFELQVSYESIGIIGDATPGGWDEDTDMIKSDTDPNMWSLFIELVDGGAKFRADDDWADNWGGTDFPAGVAAPGGDNIPVTAGFYRVDFNSETFDYSFTSVGDYASVGVIGDATPGGWEMDTDLTQDENDPTIWRGAMELLDGEAKFRADDDWTVNWGGADFPMGTATQDGANIPVVAGEYNITFNSLTGEYNFELFVVYDQVSLVGNAGPFGEWPEADDMGARDTYLSIDENDDQLWTASEVILSDTPEGGGVKFRANTDWAVNWGEVAFPAGVGTQDGPNIECIAGTYNISFNSETGEYLFSDPTGTEDILNASDIRLFPNPAYNRIALDLSKLDVSGQGVITIFDMQGRVMSRSTKTLETINTIDISELNTGNYLINVSNGKFTVGKKFSVLK